MRAILPKGWERTELGEIVTLQSGGTPNRATNIFWNGEVPWISAKDLKYFDLNDSIEHLTAIGAEHLNVVPAGTILILVRGMGLFKDFPVGITTRPMAFNQDVKALHPNAKVNTRFLAHTLLAMRSAIMGRVDRAGHGTGRLVTDYLIALPVMLPPLPEQQRIVAVLDAWDQAIDQAERLIAANRFAYRSKLNTFAELEGTSTRRLDQIAHINVRSLPASTDPEFEFDYFDIAAAEDGSERELSGRISFKNAPSRARRLVAGEAVVYSTVRPLLRRLFTAKGRPDIVYSTGYSILEPTESCMVGYLKHLLVSDRVERQVYARLTGSGYPAINENDLAEIRIPLLDIDKQVAICATLDVHEKQQSLYLRYSKALRTQKRGLMQKLLTGEWRLDERFEPEAMTPPTSKAGGRS